jgi:hypothetical protein
MPSEPALQAAWNNGTSPPNAGSIRLSLPDGIGDTKSNKSSAWTTPQNFTAFQSPLNGQIASAATSLPNLSPKEYLNSLPTTPRSLGDTDLPPQKIRDCFALYVDDFVVGQMIADRGSDFLNIMLRHCLASMTMNVIQILSMTTASFCSGLSCM